MDFVMSLGWLTLIALGLFAMMYLAYRKDDKSEENKRLIENNDKCQKLIRQYNNGVVKGKPVMTNIELKRKLIQILDEPGERDKALSRMKELANRHEEWELRMRDKRKLAYKYQQEIFEIFEKEHQQDFVQVVIAIKSKYRLQENEAIDMLDNWKSNSFVVECYPRNGVLEIGPILKSESFKLDNSDLTFQEWLDLRKLKDPI